MGKKDDKTVRIDNRVAVPNNSKRKTVLNLENSTEFYTKEAVDELVEQSVLGVTSVNTRSGAVVLTKTDVGLSNVLNADLTPAVMLNTAKTSNVQSDWNATSGLSEILNKPTSTSQVNSDWVSVSGVSEILNKPTTISTQQVSDITANNSKTGISTQQASDISTNNAKVSYTDASAVSLNTAKVTFPEASVDHRSYVRNSGEWQLLNEPFTALTDGANISWEADDDSGKINATVTLAGDRVLDNPTSLNNGTSYNLIVKQDATGTRLLTFGTLFKWAGGTAPTLSTSANAIDIFTFIYDGTNLYGSIVQNFS